MNAVGAALFLCLGCSPSRSADRCKHDEGARVALMPGPRHLRTVFVLLMENANWPDLRGSADAPYLNGTLLPKSAHADRYYSPPGVHPSEPNYLWLEGGTDYGIRDDGEPAVHRLRATDHLVTLLREAGISWKAYQEDIFPQECPTRSHGLYAAKHDPFVFFDDVTKDRAFCVAHVRPLEDLSADLQNDAVARYNFITPNLCHDMHTARACPSGRVQAGDAWLKAWVPRILASRAFREGGALFITWDESEASVSDTAIGMLVVSPFAKNGFASMTRFTHSSLLRTVQEIFGVGPPLCDAAAAPDLSELFETFP